MTDTALKPLRILAIIVTRIGDTLLCTPALRAIKAHWPEAELTVIAHARRGEVLEHLPFIDHLQGLNWLTHWRARLAFFRQPYDLALVFGDDQRQTQLALRLSKQVYAFDGARQIPLPRLTLVKQPPEIAAVQARLSLLAPLGISSDELSLAYRLTDAEKRQAAAWRATLGKPLVALQLHSFPTKAHRDWPLAHFVRLIELLSADYSAACFVITGDAHARKSAETLAAKFGECIVSVAGELSLRETAAVLASCDLYVGVDTGPTHLAGAVGIPLVALYHAAYPGRNLAPQQHPCCRMIEHPATGSDASSDADMADISPEQVWAAASELLAQRTS